MATVRIYKVAELLNLSSQDVMALLKKDHGIEVKSASSTIEEVVAREFVTKQARQRNIKVPTNASFADTPSPAARGGLKKPGGRAPEPAKPVTPVAAPRLVKTAKPIAPIEAPAPEPEPIVDETPEPAEVEAPPDYAAPSVSRGEPEVVAPAAAAEAPPVEIAAAPSAAAPVSAPSPVEATPPAAAPKAPAAAEHAATPAEPAAPAAAAPPPAPARPTPAPGRIVPPTLRLRVEDPKTGQAPPAPPRRPLLVRPPVSTTPPPAATGNLSKPVAPPPRPGGPAAPRPGGPPRAGAYPRPQSPMGGPRPLPSQPVRPSQPLRPNVPGYRPPPPRPSGPRSSGPRRDPRPQAPTMNNTPPPPVTRTITLAEGMTVSDLALKLDVKAKDVMKKLMEKRMMVTINSTLDTETTSMIAREFGADVKMQTFEEELLQVETEESNPEDIVTRGPVVTVMGHVDHGKTTLLDAIRETRVAEREAGGITQHIGAYAVQVHDRNVVFLDTPGHAAFTMMRARGARVTDVVVLVVAADDGVMPQTREAIDHARAANVPILVAINKIDKAGANPDRVKKELSDLGLVPEDWGGQTVTVPLSAKKRENIPALLEMVLLVTELSELKANPKRNASGTVLEAKLDKGRGPVATILVQDGTLRVGDTL
ncbi:MAG TPA: translation initiation factor IF-2, partial [Vicinamibacterales bacterium]|nr:translation initiation factor IF-2 [Vicinamibacterales bacterium]